MYKRIIVPIEIGGLDRGEKALRKASTLLEKGGEIILLNVVEDVPTYVAIDLPPELRQNAIDDAEQKLGMLIRTSGIPAMIEIGHGRPAHSILAAAEAHDADLIIVASHIPDFSNSHRCHRRPRRQACQMLGAGR